MELVSASQHDSAALVMVGLRLRHTTKLCGLLVVGAAIQHALIRVEFNCSRSADEK
jgi:hypothetical protein